MLRKAGYNHGVWRLVRAALMRAAVFAAVFVPVQAAHAAPAPATLGTLMDNFTTSSNQFTTLISLFAYITGVLFAVIGVFKFKEHVDNPAQNPLSAGVKRILAGGMLLSLPWMANAVQNNLFGDATGDGGIAPTEQLTALAGAEAGQLDTMIVDFMIDIAGPMQTLLSLFAYISAAVFLVVAILRLTKRMDEGVRGPGGIGTIMTFVTAGALFAFADSLGAFTESIFGNDGQVSTAVSVNVSGVSAADAARMENAIQGIMLFVIFVGIIAFIRGWFVLRAYADGQQGVSLAQGLTFLGGGIVAINLGDFINAIQNTLNITGSLTFS